MTLQLPPAEDLYDENYGHTQVYYQQLKVQIPTQAGQTYQVSWQGVPKTGFVILLKPLNSRLTYPVWCNLNLLARVIKVTGSKQLFLATQPIMANSADDLESGNTDSKIVEVISTRSSSDSAQDQQWSARLAESSLAYGLLLFLAWAFCWHLRHALCRCCQF